MSTALKPLPEKTNGTVHYGLTEDEYAALVAGIQTNQLWEDHKTMLHFLRSAFGEFTAFDVLERRLQMNVGGDTPRILLEECIVQMWKDSDLQRAFGSFNNLKEYVLYSIQESTESVLPVTGYSSSENIEVFNTSRKYFIQRKLGQGGQATAYKAVHDGRVVAVKVAGEKMTKQFADRARRESRANMGLNAVPGVVQMHGFGVKKDACIMEMEYMDAGSLKKFINPENIHNTQYQQLGVVWFQNVARAFSKVHPGNTHGITPVIHRDIKPDNLLINSDGELKIADFGLALIDNKHSVTMANGRMGTANLMAPEMILNGALNVDEKVDVYALGITMYHFFAGKEPIQVNIQADVFKHTNLTIDYDALPNKELAYIIQQMLEKDPRKRCTMKEAANALQHLLTTNLFTRTQQNFYANQLQSTDYLQLDPSVKNFFTNEITVDYQKHNSVGALQERQNDVTGHALSDNDESRFQQTVDVSTGSPFPARKNTPEPAVTIVPANTPEPAVTIVPGNTPEPAVTIVPGNTPESVDAKDVTASQADDTGFTLHLHDVTVPTRTEKIIDEIFAKLEHNEVIGRTTLRRIQALVMANKTLATVVLAGSVLATTALGIGAVKLTTYNAAVAAVKQTRDDLAELLKRPTKIAAHDWQSIIAKYNVVNDIDGNEADDRLLKVLEQANTNNQYTVEANEHGDIVSIVPTVDLHTQELHTQIVEVAKQLNGTAQAIDGISLDAVNTMFTTILATPFVGNESEVVTSLQSLMPDQYQIVNINGVLHVQHKVEQADVQAIVACYNRLSDALRTEDNPSVPAVLTVLAELNTLRTNWIHRSNVLQMCETICITSLPNFITNDIVDGKLVVRNKTYVLEDGTEVIESRFGNFFIRQGIVDKVITEEDTIIFEKSKSFKDPNSPSVYAFHVMSMGEAQKLYKTISEKLDMATIASYEYYSFALPNGFTLFFSNKVQGFFTIDDQKNISYISSLNEVYDNESLFKILIHLNQINFANYSEVSSIIGIDKETIDSEILKFVNYVGMYPTYRHRAAEYQKNGEYLFQRYYKIIFGDKTPEEVLGLPPKEPIPADQVQNTSGGGNN